jgi:DNA-binding response OmpR family regulator
MKQVGEIRWEGARGLSRCAEKKVIMVVDDDLVERTTLRFILEQEGYRCIEVQDEQHAVDLAQFHVPNLILMDRNMPHKSGLELSLEIKGKLHLAQIPIIMVTAADKVEEKVEAFEDGVDDYICKPYEPIELLARVKAALRSSQEAIDRNPTTLLPGACALEGEIQKRLDDDKIFALLHADLDNFKPYADSHGFSLANMVIKHTGKLIYEAAEQSGGDCTFVAHIGGDDFIIIATLDCYETIARAIIESFDREIVRYFSEEEINQGYYLGKTRAGEDAHFPIMTISAGVITNKGRSYANSTEMGIDLSQAKRKAKSVKCSNYYLWDPIVESAV